LQDSSQTDAAVSILKKAKQVLITRQGVEALTQGYINAGDYNAAVNSQLFLANYLPNKFRPKYNLLQIYIRQNDTLNIIRTGKMILDMPKKKSSFEIEQIKRDTRDILKKYN
jgi:hypothetical protein